jgi:hypothetical protein
VCVSLIRRRLLSTPSLSAIRRLVHAPTCAFSPASRSNHRRRRRRHRQLPLPLQLQLKQHRQSPFKLTGSPPLLFLCFRSFLAALKPLPASHHPRVLTRRPLSTLPGQASCVGWLSSPALALLHVCAQREHKYSTYYNKERVCAAFLGFDKNEKDCCVPQAHRPRCTRPGPVSGIAQHCSGTPSCGSLRPPPVRPCFTFCLIIFCLALKSPSHGSTSSSGHDPVAPPSSSHIRRRISRPHGLTLDYERTLIGHPGAMAS